MSAIKLNVSYNSQRDSDIWQDLKSGSRMAMDRIYYAHVPALMAYGKQFTSDSGLVDDCIQDLLLDVWVKRSRLGHTTSIRFYLLKSLKRRIFRSLKKEEKKALFEDMGAVYTESFTTRIKDDHVNENIRLMKLVNELSPVQKEIIFLKFFNDLSFDEIGEVLELDKKQLYNALAKAMHRLRNLLQIPFLITLSYFL